MKRAGVSRIHFTVLELKILVSTGCLHIPISNDRVFDRCLPYEPEKSSWTIITYFKPFFLRVVWAFLTHSHNASYQSGDGDEPSINKPTQDGSHLRKVGWILNQFFYLCLECSQINMGLYNFSHTSFGVRDER